MGAIESVRASVRTNHMATPARYITPSRRAPTLSITDCYRFVHVMPISDCSAGAVMVGDLSIIDLFPALGKKSLSPWRAYAHPSPVVWPSTHRNLHRSKKCDDFCKINCLKCVLCGVKAPLPRCSFKSCPGPVPEARCAIPFQSANWLL